MKTLIYNPIFAITYVVSWIIVIIFYFATRRNEKKFQSLFVLSVNCFNKKRFGFAGKFLVGVLAAILSPILVWFDLVLMLGIMLNNRRTRIQQTSDINNYLIGWMEQGIKNSRACLPKTMEGFIHYNNRNHSPLVDLCHEFHSINALLISEVLEKNRIISKLELEETELQIENQRLSKELEAKTEPFNPFEKPVIANTFKTPLKQNKKQEPRFATELEKVFDTRTMNVLSRYKKENKCGLFFVGDLKKISLSKLKLTRGIGQKTIDQILTCAKKLDIEFKK